MIYLLEYFSFIKYYNFLKKINFSFYNIELGVSLNSPGVKTLYFQCRGSDLIPYQESKIPHAVWGSTSSPQEK